ncbi:MAG: hypothetical protein ACI906_001886 [Candidatus Latescibacterota bacterium]
MALSFQLPRISKMSPFFALLFFAVVSMASADEIGTVQVYLSPEEGRAKIFPAAVRFERELHQLSPAAKAGLIETLGRNFSEDSLAVDLAYGKDGALLGYAIVAEEIGKFRPITFMVGVDRQFAVQKAAVLVYRESRGAQVRQPRFLRQYMGKDLGDPIRINRDIINISGATLSVRSLNFGVRKVLALAAHFYRAPESAMP